jgi:hypothetical protein
VEVKNVVLVPEFNARPKRVSEILCSSKPTIAEIVRAAFPIEYQGIMVGKLSHQLRDQALRASRYVKAANDMKYSCWTAAPWQFLIFSLSRLG